MPSAETEPRPTGWSRVNPLRVRRSAADWVVDSLLFAASLAVWALYSVSPAAYPAIPSWFWPLDIVMGLLLCLSLWWTRSNPVAVGVFAIIPGSFAVTATLAVVVVIFRLAMYARPRVSAAIVGLHIAAALPYHGLFPIAGMQWVTWIVIILLIYVVAWSFGLLARARRLVLEAAQLDAARARELLDAEVARADRIERERIAREMHDVLAHRVSLISVHAGALEFRTAAESPESALSESDIHRTAGVIRENAHLAIEELREVLAVLRDESGEPESRHPQPRVADIAILLDDARAAGQLVEADIDPFAGDLPGGAQRSVYRIVQEGLTNARKHAPGSRVRVSVSLSATAMRVRVSNAVPVGVTQSQIPGGRAGLHGLAERVRVEAGALTYGVVNGEFELVADLPRRHGGDS